MNKKLVKKDNSCRIITRQEKQKEILIDQLFKTPIIQIACEKLGIARSTFYRWKNEDKDFDEKMTEALEKGKMLINDMAESRLISGIQGGNMTAVIYWLKHNHKGYKENKDKLLSKDIQPVRLMITTYDKNKHKKLNNIPMIGIKEDNDN